MGRTRPSPQELEDGLACLPAGLKVLEQPDTALVTPARGQVPPDQAHAGGPGKPVVYLKRLTMGAAHAGPGPWKGGSGRPPGLRRRWPLCGRRKWPGREHSRPTRHSRACQRCLSAAVFVCALP